jgi:hypothetical protein
MLIAAIITALLVTLGILSPFVFGKGGSLAAASSESSIEKLNAQKELILARFIQDELSFQRKEIGARAWAERQRFLVNRYIDVARRMDYLHYIKQQNRGDA